jgi:uncharacterized protein involved in copper resistance
MKRLLTLLFTAVLAFSFAMPVLAQETSTSETAPKAETKAEKKAEKKAHKKAKKAAKKEMKEESKGATGETK